MGFCGGFGGGAVAAFVDDVLGAVLDFVEEDADVLSEYADSEELDAAKKDDGCHDGTPSGFGVAEAENFAEEGPKGEEDADDDGEEAEA